MWIPKTLYEAIPYLLFIIGGMAILKPTNPLMLGSGLVLLAIGAIIWSMRRTYRKTQRFDESLPTPPRLPVTPTETARRPSSGRARPTR